MAQLLATWHQRSALGEKLRLSAIGHTLFLSTVLFLRRENEIFFYFVFSLFCYAESHGSRVYSVLGGDGSFPAVSIPDSLITFATITAPYSP